MTNIFLIDTLVIIVHNLVAFAFIVIASACLDPSLVDQVAFTLVTASLAVPLAIASFVIGHHIPLAVITSLVGHHNLKLVPFDFLQRQLPQRLIPQQLLRRLHYPQQR